MKFTAETFQNRDVTLDFNQFFNCKFDNCNIIYNGNSFTAVGCDFYEVRITLIGNAKNVLKFMSAFYKMGAKESIEKTFENIRQGVYLK